MEQPTVMEREVVRLAGLTEGVLEVSPRSNRRGLWSPDAPHAWVFRREPVPREDNPFGIQENPPVGYDVTVAVIVAPGWDRERVAGAVERRVRRYFEELSDLPVQVKVLADHPPSPRNWKWSW